MMSNQKWSIEVIELPLKFDWKISRNTSEAKTNLVVKVEEGDLSGLGEVAFNVRYQESLESVKNGFQRFLESSARSASSALTLQEEMQKIELDRSLRFGIESAWIHLQAEKAGQSVYQYLELDPPSSVATSFSLPILPVGDVKGFIHRFGLGRFSTLKVKVNEDAEASVREVARHFSGPLRIDANEAWKSADEVLQFIENVKDINIEFVEQPLPADQEDELLELKNRSSVTLIGDESLTDEGVSEFHKDRFHGVNVKLMKAGGLVAALEQLKKARALGLQTMLGCMVETSLGISSALHLSAGVDYIDLDGFLFLKEDPFGAVLEKSGQLTLA